jgi:magnesium-protoporphyrin O-methyltransferase
MDCSCSSDYEEVFSERAATVTAARFRRRGLTGTSRRIVATLTKLGQHPSSVLEVGGGIGEIQVAMLENGLAESATNVELAGNWEKEAARLLEERGLRDRVTRLRGDFVQLAPTLPIADVVILNRVVCCYPRWRDLLSHAGSLAKRHLIVTFPRPGMRALVGIENLYHRLRARSFRAFVHPAKAMMGLLTQSGFHARADHRSLVWRTVLVSRRENENGS